MSEKSALGAIIEITSEDRNSKYGSPFRDSSLLVRKSINGFMRLTEYFFSLLFRIIRDRSIDVNVSKMTGGRREKRSNGKKKREKKKKGKGKEKD